VQAVAAAPGGFGFNLDTTTEFTIMIEVLQQFITSAPPVIISLLQQFIPSAPPVIISLLQQFIPSAPPVLSRSASSLLRPPPAARYGLQGT
jgi:hypothetical protein